MTSPSTSDADPAGDKALGKGKSKGKGGGHAGSGPAWRYNPAELAFDSLGTVVAMKSHLLAQVPDLRLGLVATDRELSRPAYDSVYESDTCRERWAREGVPGGERYEAPLLLDCDLVLCHDRVGDTGLPLVQSNPAQEPSRRVIARLAPQPLDGDDVHPGTLAPTFDDTTHLADFVYHWLRRRASATPIYGLLLTGGESRRMGRDKALLEIGGVSQLERAGRLLEGICDRVFISTRPGQRQPSPRSPASTSGRDNVTICVPGSAPPIELANVPPSAPTPAWPHLDDQFLGLGPLGGILTAQRAHPDAAWLVLACDLPMVTADTLDALLRGRDPLRYATAFRSTFDDFPEPLCTLWEPKSHYRLMHFLGLGYSCPRKALINSRIALLTPDDPHWLDNVNHPDEFDAARRRLEAP